jgi:hypothetical protein
MFDEILSAAKNSELSGITLEFEAKVQKILEQRTGSAFQLGKGGLFSQERRELAMRYSYAIPSTKALELIGKYSPLIEMGAGNGYWSHLLQERGTDIIAFDIAPPANGKNEKFIGNKTWTKVWKGDQKALLSHSDRTLFLCWPPYQEKMASGMLKAYKGDYLIYVGEVGDYSNCCTGDELFHKNLHQDFQQVESLTLTTWPGNHDYLSVWKRNK